MQFTEFLKNTVNVDDFEKKEIIIDFWKEFYMKNFETLQENNSSNSNRHLYKDSVIQKLSDFKKNNKEPYPKDALRELQLQIETLTIMFDEESIHITCNHIMKEMIDPKKESAKDYVLERLTSDQDKSIVSDMGQYTLEAIIVYVISLLYSSETSMIRVSTLIDQLDRQVRSHHSILMRNKHKKKVEMIEVGQNVVLGEDFPIGVALINFIAERGLMTIQLMDNKKFEVPMKKKKGKYFIPKSLYAIYNFDISLLSLKLNLPMICKPVDWQSALGVREIPKSLSDLKGGYLSGMSEYSRYKLLSSGNENNYYINIEKGYDTLCKIMNALQSEPFQISKIMLSNIKENYQEFVNAGLLMPSALSQANMKKLSENLRNYYMNNKKGIRSIYSYDEVLTVLHKDVQRARFEQITIMLADAFDGFLIYIPVFLDFRGRIYRSGLLHFHERDLVRSLLLFAGKEEIDEDKISILKQTIAFHYMPFSTYQSAENWYIKESLVWVQMNLSDFIKYASEAKKPFQFISSILSHINPDLNNCVPITQDASSSAYQIMSYLLLDKNMAKNTNLLTYNGTDHIFDIYTDMKENLVRYILSLPEDSSKEKTQIVMDYELKKIVYNTFDRKLVKSLFMPIIYGKSLMSTATDLRAALSKYVTKKDSFILAEICFQFWKETYPHMDCLIRLIRNIGWIVSSRGDHVVFKNHIYTTVQKYMKQDPVNVWIYDKMNKKRHQVTLRVPTEKNDKRKSEISTFVNFIHQLDAFYAMKVVGHMLLKRAPIYTVHDNFLSIPNHCANLPNMYKMAFMSTDPLSIINGYIYTNVIEHLGCLNELSQEEMRFFVKMQDHCGKFSLIIPHKMLQKYLKKNKPTGLKKKKDIETWESKISTIATSYQEYTRYICKGKVLGENSLEQYNNCISAYQENLNDFHNRMKENETNYSLHY